MLFTRKIRLDDDAVEDIIAYFESNPQKAKTFFIKLLMSKVSQQQLEEAFEQLTEQMHKVTFEAAENVKNKIDENIKNYFSRATKEIIKHDPFYETVQKQHNQLQYLKKEVDKIKDFLAQFTVNVTFEKSTKKENEEDL